MSEIDSESKEEKKEESTMEKNIPEVVQATPSISNLNS
jgi:hypothetical protein